MSFFLYFDTDHAIKVHDNIIEKSGGLKGIIKYGQLDSIIQFVQNDIYYPTMDEKLAYLFFAINTGHCFVDGNKRSSIALSAYFMIINGLSFQINRFIIEMENIAIDVADNRVDKNLLKEIIYSILYEDDFCEELKIKLVNAKML